LKALITITGPVIKNKQIISYARQIIYEHLTEIKNKGGKIFQVECHSIIFSFPSTTCLPVNVSESLGDFKFEIEGEILCYYSFGPKNYAITFKDQHKKFKTVVYCLKMLHLKMKYLYHYLKSFLKIMRFYKVNVSPNFEQRKINV
jgi:hypothetical protein